MQRPTLQRQTDRFGRTTYRDQYGDAYDRILTAGNHHCDRCGDAIKGTHYVSCGLPTVRYHPRCCTVHTV